MAYNRRQGEDYYNATLEEVAKQLSIEEGKKCLSRERIRQIEVNALKKIKDEMIKQGLFEDLAKDINEM